MIDLKKISKGREQRPPRVLVYGSDGIGKTKFSAGAPDPFFIDADNGSYREDVRRVIPENWDDFTDCLAHAEKLQGAVVLDSITTLEAMLHRKLFPGTTVEAYDGGFGRGDTYAVSAWREVLAQLERIWHQGRSVVLVAHATTKSFNDPSGPSYDRFEVSCRPKLASTLRQWVDYVCFCREDIINPKPKEKKATTTGARWAYTRRCPAYDAKARGTLLFPERVPLHWDAFVEEIKKDDTRGKELRDEIDTMLTEISDGKLDIAVRDYLKNNPEKILEARDRVAARLAEHRGNPQETSAV